LTRTHTYKLLELWELSPQMNKTLGYDVLQMLKILYALYFFHITVNSKCYVNNKLKHYFKKLSETENISSYQRNKTHSTKSHHSHMDVLSSVNSTVLQAHLHLVIFMETIYALHILKSVLLLIDTQIMNSD
jgi:hypothetical protein